ncbi:hypothetical protein ADUPG1_010689 [Aduncisulcus paluster]|uniref:Tr-type G domain-containing protein n=1 Tax=Aduncisulcus paluster TaxID=2918883 RepID=A0ABQ5JST9_9EUKA|nr:hypothetical protein ADUPG1_010689 [Aduncisulcus paluster]
MNKKSKKNQFSYDERDIYDPYSVESAGSYDMSGDFYGRRESTDMYDLMPTVQESGGYDEGDEFDPYGMGDIPGFDEEEELRAEEERRLEEERKRKADEEKRKLAARKQKEAERKKQMKKVAEQRRKEKEEEEKHIPGFDEEEELRAEEERRLEEERKRKADEEKRKLAARKQKEAERKKQMKKVAEQRRKEKEEEEKRQQEEEERRKKEEEDKDDPSHIEERLRELSVQYPDVAPPSLVKKCKTLSDNSNTLQVITAGHVDAGKSTLMGHLMLLCSRLSSSERHSLKKLSQAAKDKGKESFVFAWTLDDDEMERDRGVTVDVAHTHFTIPSTMSGLDEDKKDIQDRSVFLRDAPGHRSFVPNLITKAQAPDVGVLVVDSVEQELVAALSAEGQCWEHMLLLRAVGVQRLIVCVNKLDRVDWSEVTYAHVCSTLKKYLKKAGFDVRDESEQVVFIPISGYHGVNLIPESSRARIAETFGSEESKGSEDTDEESSSSAPTLVPPALSSVMPWYDGPSLATLLFNAPIQPRLLEHPFVCVVSDVSKAKFSGKSVMSGRIASGCLVEGEVLVLLPFLRLLRVTAIVDNTCGVGKPVTRCYGGMYVSLSFKPLGASEGFGGGYSEEEIEGMVKSGCVLCRPSQPVRVSNRLTIQVRTTELEHVLLKGERVDMFIHSMWSCDNTCGVGKPVTRCYGGMYVSLSFKPLGASEGFGGGYSEEEIEGMVKSGCVLCRPSQPVRVSNRLTIQVRTTELEHVLLKGERVDMFIHSMWSCGLLKRFVSEMNNKGVVIQKKPRKISSNTNAIVRVQTDDVVPMLPHSIHPLMGRIVLRLNSRTIAIGVITETHDVKI